MNPARTVTLVFLVFVISAMPCKAQSYDLSGMWRDDRGRTMPVRQIGNTVYWSLDARPRVVNVFVGTLSGSTITGTWVDLPGGWMQGSGTLALRAESNDRFVKVSENNGPCAESVWVRVGGTGGAGTGTGSGGGGARRSLGSCWP